MGLDMYLYTVNKKAKNTKELEERKSKIATNEEEIKKIKNQISTSVLPVFRA